MSKVMDLAEALGQAIEEDEAFVQYRQAKEQYDQDEPLQQLISEYNLKKMAVMNHMSSNSSEADDTKLKQLQDELHALNLGADEFLTKPCRKERLLARVSNVLKRYEGRNNLLEGNGFLLDRQTYTLYIHNRSVILPQNQGKILGIFLEHGSDIVTKEELCIALWGTAEFIDENALQVNLTRLKKTMANLDMPQQILPVRGVGYRFVGQTLER